MGLPLSIRLVLLTFSLALLDRGADPTLQDISIGAVPLLNQSYFGIVNNVARLLQHPRVRANVNLQGPPGFTALHCTCLSSSDETSVTSIIRLLLQAGGNPKLANNAGESPLLILRTCHLSYRDAIALLEQFPDTEKDAEKASLLVKARRLTIATASNTVVPFCLRARIAGGQPLPHVELVQVTGGNKRAKKRRKLRIMLAFLLGMRGGQKNMGMPRDVFRAVLDLLMPTWDPLRRKGAGTGPPAVQD